MEYKKLIVTCEDNIASIVLNSPETLNGMDMILTDELLKALAQCEKDESVRVVVISGAGKAFCGGGDIRFMHEHAREPSFAEKFMDPLVYNVAKVTLNIKKLSKPVICSVAGAAAGGGCNLAFAGDFVFAADNAKFLQAFVGIALSPDTGAAYFMTRSVGTHRTVDMFMTGKPISADEAYRLGIVKEVCTVENLREKTMAFAKTLAAGPSISYRNIKKLLFESEYKGYEKFIDVEVATQRECAESQDFYEGISAFLEKRKPLFKGN